MSKIKDRLFMAKLELSVMTNIVRSEKIPNIRLVIKESAMKYRKNGYISALGFLIYQSEFFNNGADPALSDLLITSGNIISGFEKKGFSISNEDLVSYLTILYSSMTGARYTEINITLQNANGTKFPLTLN